MSDTVKAPWHIWVVGILSLLWNGYGGYDYIMSQIGDEEYMAMMTEPFGFSAADAVAYFESFPLWADAAWAVGVWGSVLGSILILARSRFAFHAFTASMAGLLVAMVYQYGNPLPGATDSGISIAFTLAITAIMLALIYYCRRMTARGVLR